MGKMKLIIANGIFQKYPKTQLGYVVARIHVKKTSAYTEGLKAGLKNELKAINVTAKTYEKHPHIAGWKKIFSDFGASKDQRSSVEALVKRVVTGGKPWNISNVVDLYNYCSAMSMMPMGGYDLHKIRGDISIRYGAEGEAVAPLGTEETFPVSKDHVIYSDNEKVLCWLWNYRDSRYSCIDDNTKDAIFFIDAASDESPDAMTNALKLFRTQLERIGAIVLENGVLSSKMPEVELDLDKLFDKVPEASKVETEAESKAVALMKQSGKSAPAVEHKGAAKEKKAQSQESVAHTSTASMHLNLLTPAQVAKDTRFAINYAATGDLARLQEMIKHNPEAVREPGSFGNNLLLQAVRGEHVNVVNFLLDEYPNVFDINHRNQYKDSAILMAVSFNLKKIIPTLLARHPADVEEALVLARGTGRTEIIAELTRYLARKNQNSSDPLIQAAKSGDIGAVEKLVKAGHDLNAADKESKTAYMHAIQNGHTKVAAFLRSHGAKRPHDAMGNLVSDDMDTEMEQSSGLSLSAGSASR